VSKAVLAFYVIIIRACYPFSQGNEIIFGGITKRSDRRRTIYSHETPRSRTNNQGRFTSRRSFNAFSLAKEGTKKKLCKEETDGTFRNIKLVIYSVPSPNIPRGFTSAFRQSGNGIFTTLGAYCTGAFRRLRAATNAHAVGLPFAGERRKFLKKV